MLKNPLLAGLGLVFLVAMSPLTASAAVRCPSLSFGSSGPRVIALQNFLANEYTNFPTPPTGYFGPITQAAVKQWQCENGIVCSGTAATTGYGVVGPRTAAAMKLCTASGTTQAAPITPTTVPVPSPKAPASTAAPTASTVPTSNTNVPISSTTPATPAPSSRRTEPIVALPTAQTSADDGVIPGKYIVVLKPASVQGTANALRTKELLKRYHAENEYSQALNGFSSTLSSEEVVELQGDPLVDYVVPDRVMQSDMFITGSQNTTNGIKRINAVNLANKGTGVGVAVIDSGIDSTHPDLAGSVVGGVNCSDDQSVSPYDDDRGHGTHLAGIIAAQDNGIGVVGVAPEAKLWSVKVSTNNIFNLSNVICGLNFITANAPANGGTIAVANMSAGFFGSSDNNCGATRKDALHAAMCAARDAGVTIVVSAGNAASDASGQAPASYTDTVITVSAFSDSDGMPGGRGGSFRADDAPGEIHADDTFAPFSNYGNAVTIGAPGVNIVSTNLRGGYESLSGTSYAAPYVAGAAALYIAQHPGASFTEVRNALVSGGEPAGPTTHNGFNTTGSIAHPERVLLASGESTYYFNATTPVSGYSPLNVSFVTRRPCDARVYSIEYGDETSENLESCPAGTSSGASFVSTRSHEYINTGSYTATLKAQNGGSSENIAQVVISAYTPTTDAITLTAPSGGEQWRLGETHDITWVSSLVGKTASIFLSDGCFLGSAPISAGRYALHLNPSSSCFRAPRFISGSYKIVLKYDLTKFGGESASFSISDTVVVPLTPTASITQSLPTTVAGQPYDINWSSSNVASCTVDGSRNGETPIVYQTTLSGGPWTIAPTVVGTHVWRINCTGPNGPASDTFTHTVTSATTPAPTLTFTASPTTIPYGGTSTITWSSTNTTSIKGAAVCELNAGTPVVLQNSVVSQGASGTAVTPALATTNTFAMTCTGTGGSVTKSVTITVTPVTPTPTASITQSLPTTVAGNPYSISWKSSNVSSCIVDGSRNGETPIVYQTTVSGGPWTISPTVVGTHVWRINCTGPNGPASDTFTHTVTSAAPTASLTITGPSVTNVHTITLQAGDANTKTWSSSGGTSWSSTYAYSNVPGATCSKNGVNGPWGANTANGGTSGNVAQVADIGCLVTITYTVRNALGQTASDSIFVTVVAAATSYNFQRRTQVAGVAGAIGGPTPAPQNFSYTFTQDLYRGESGAEVVALQQALRAEGLFSGEITGNFYDFTREAVTNFQEKYGINATGYVGPATRAKLNELY